MSFGNFFPVFLIDKISDIYMVGRELLKLKKTYVVLTHDMVYYKNKCRRIYGNIPYMKFYAL